MLAGVQVTQDMADNHPESALTEPESVRGSRADGVRHSHSHNAPGLVPATVPPQLPEDPSEGGSTEPEAHRLRVSSGHDVEPALESHVLRWPTDAVPGSEQQGSHGSVNPSIQESDASSTQPDSSASAADAAWDVMGVPALEQPVMLDQDSGGHIGVGALQPREHLGGSAERQPGSVEGQPGGTEGAHPPGGTEGARPPDGTEGAHPPGGSCAAPEPESDSRALDLEAWPVLLTDGSVSGSDDEHCFPRQKDREAFRVKRGRRRPATRCLFESFD